MRILKLNKYKLICISSLLVLSSVQFWLLYNTYQFKDQHLYLTERQLIEREYGRGIKDDKMFPGGQGIMDHYINPMMDRLEALYKRDRNGFDVLRRQICQQMFDSLRQANNIDSILKSITQKHHLKKMFTYGLIIDFVGVTFDGDSVIGLFDKGETGDGFRVGGSLRRGGLQNLVTNLTVSSPIAHSYRITYSLYVDSDQRRLDIVKKMVPSFSLSFFSILSVLLLFYITFRNWTRQKGIADMKSDFINSINHEFHTPLATIMVATRSLKTQGIREERGRMETLVDVIQRQSERLNNLFGQVLDITGLQNIKLRKSEHSLNGLIQGILQDYRLKFASTEVDFEFVSCAAPDIVLVDAFWFTTMINNLLDNGIKYNKQARKQIKVTTINDKRKILLTIEDNGIGMDPETRKHVFEKFYRGKEAGSRPNGLGLGLYYAKLCADAHRWNISVESEPGFGSRFNIAIPI